MFNFWKISAAAIYVMVGAGMTIEAVPALFCKPASIADADTLIGVALWPATVGSRLSPYSVPMRMDGRCAAKRGPYYDNR